jgi:Ca2+-binding EF-hand superfamily protein
MSLALDHKKSVEVSPEEKEFMLAVFAQLNKNGDGYLDKNDLVQGLIEMGHSDPSVATVVKMLAAVGLEDQGKISLEDFEIMWKNKPEDSSTFAGFLDALGSSLLF